LTMIGLPVVLSRMKQYSGKSARTVAVSRRWTVINDQAP
jgi:hypothetical protein